MTGQLGFEILDACCGGRMWWWDKDHPLAMYMDIREAPAGSIPVRPNWKCEPTVLGDFRRMPFDDEAFQLVLFDPPHIKQAPSESFMQLKYGQLDPTTWEADLAAGFAECWRVLAPGGSLLFKWNGTQKEVELLWPAEPIVGTRQLHHKSGGGTRWFIFYKPLGG